VTFPDVGQPPASGQKPKLVDVTTTSKPHLSTGEFQELEDLVSEFADIFARYNEDYGRTNKVYHRIDTGDARPIHQPKLAYTLRMAPMHITLGQPQGRKNLESYTKFHSLVDLYRLHRDYFNYLHGWWIQGAHFRYILNRQQQIGLIYPFTY
jgi:hypothetical protein